MLRLLILSTLQSILLVSGQIFLKFALTKMLPFSWTWAFFRSALFNWQFSASGIASATTTSPWPTHYSASATSSASSPPSSSFTSLSPPFVGWASS